MNAEQPSPATEAIARLAKAAGDELRVEILRALATDSYGVLELSQAFGMRQSGMSHHLKVLAKAGLVATRREGNSIFYRRMPIVAQDPCGAFKSGLFVTLDAQPLPETVRARLAEVHAERARTSQQFFLGNAHKFREQQDLIASFPVYGQQVLELMDATPVPGNAQVLEVGPGEGELLPALAERFDAVVGLDNSDAMLAKARLQCEASAGVTLVHGDTGALRTIERRFDCAVINMVLHHTSSPRRVFADVGRTLNPDGALLVTELCHHDQDWVRNACGDLWLGFDPADLSLWAREAGLDEGQSIYFALRNGFQIQIRQFFKRRPSFAHQ